MQKLILLATLVISSQFTEAKSTCASTNKEGSMCASECKSGYYAFCEQEADQPQCVCREIDALSNPPPNGGNLFMARVEVEKSTPCAAEHPKSRTVWLKFNDRTSSESNITAIICRKTLVNSTNGYTESRQYEKIEGTAGEKKYLGCFIPEFSEFHLAYTSLTRDAGNRLNMDHAENALVTYEIGSGRIPYTFNHHQSKTIITRTTFRGEYNTTNLDPGDSTIGTLRDAKYVAPYNHNTPLSCTSFGDKSTSTDPWIEY